jgi:hypothetical protein
MFFKRRYLMQLGVLQALDVASRLGDRHYNRVHTAPVLVDVLQALQVAVVRRRVDAIAKIATVLVGVLHADHVSIFGMVNRFPLRPG